MPSSLNMIMRGCTHWYSPCFTLTSIITSQSKVNLPVMESMLIMISTNLSSVRSKLTSSLPKERLKIIKLILIPQCGRNTLDGKRHSLTLSTHSGVISQRLRRSLGYLINSKMTQDPKYNRASSRVLRVTNRTVRLSRNYYVRTILYPKMPQFVLQVSISPI